MDTFLLRIFLTLSGLVSMVLSQTCEQVHYQRCVEQLDQFAGKDDLIFVMTEPELTQQCVQAQSALGCITRYIKKCVGLEERKKLSDGVSGFQRLISGLCSEGSELRSRYLESLPCLRNSSEGIQFCQEKFKRNQNDILLVSYEDKTPLYCCSFDGYRRCLRMLFQVQDECQEGTPEVLDEIVQRMSGVLGEGVCEEYFERCTGGGAVTIVAYTSCIVFMLLSLLTRTFFHSYL